MNLIFGLVFWLRYTKGLCRIKMKDAHRFCMKEERSTEINLRWKYTPIVFRLYNQAFKS